MSSTTYRWTKVWCIMTDPGDCSPGDVILIESQNGLNEATVTHVAPYLTKNGKEKELAFVHTDEGQ